jgi:hypothetical protein
MTSKCRAEVDACRAQPPSDANGGGGGAAGGSVPAALVGTWTSHGGGAVIVHTYGAAGSYHESSGLSSSGSCPMTTAFEIDGKVEFAAATVTYREVSGTSVTKTCSSEGSPKPVTPATVTKSWRLEGGVLYTWDATCNDYKTCAVQFTK